MIQGWLAVRQSLLLNFVVLTLGMGMLAFGASHRPQPVVAAQPTPTCNQGLSRLDLNSLPYWGDTNPYIPHSDKVRLAQP